MTQTVKNSNDKSGGKLVVVNQAANYLTIGFCNAFYEKLNTVALVTGSIHVQGEELNPGVAVSKINRWHEAPAWKKLGSYLWGCCRIYFLLMTRYRNYEVLFVSLPPMAYLLSIILPHRCSMIIWDVYPDIFKIVGWSESNLIYRVWAYLNKMVFRKAYRVITISDVMAQALHAYVAPQKLKVQPIWSIFQDEKAIDPRENTFIGMHNLHNKFVVQYSGNIGLSHKVEVMIELASLMRNESDVVFQIIGRGPRKALLERMVKERNLPNCQFLPFQDDAVFPYSLSAANLGVVILDSITSKGSVPSKSYNLMSYGIPSLYIAGRDSQLYSYVQQFQHGLCIEESKLGEAVDFIRLVKNDQTLRTKLRENSLRAASHFKRSNADQFVNIYLNQSA